MAASAQEIGRWLAVVDVAPGARTMTAAQAPPVIDEVRLSAEGHPVGGHYLPVGLSVDVEVIATNCAELTVRLPGVAKPVEIRPQDWLGQQHHRAQFVANQSGLVEVLGAANAFGQALQATPPCAEVLTLEPLSPPPAIVFGPITIEPINIEALLSWWRKGEADQ